MSNQPRRRRRHRSRRRYVLATILTLLLIALTWLILAAWNSEASPTEPTENGSQPNTETLSSDASSMPETAPESVAEPWMPEERDVEYIAKTLYGEALVVKSDTRRAAVAWCILNRVDSYSFQDTIEGVVTAPHQFSGYDPDHPVLPELRDLAIDVLQRWNAEKNGEAEVGRVLPRNYCFFIGDGFENHFSAEWKSTDYWDWSLPSPYKN